jgi:prepilin-type N-terminal cleavage/methylation domain-containing protein
MRNAKGFTLIELLIVVAIVAILAAVLIPNILNARARALQAAAQSYARDILIALESVQSTFTQVDWRQTALANTITVVSNKRLQTVNSGWKDGAGNDVNPMPTVKFEDFLKDPGQTGIEAAIVGKKTVGAGNQASNVVLICVSQKVGSNYNIYSLYPDNNQFLAKLNERAAATDIGNCP